MVSAFGWPRHCSKLLVFCTWQLVTVEVFLGLWTLDWVDFLWTNQEVFVASNKQAYVNGFLLHLHVL